MSILQDIRISLRLFSRTPIPTAIALGSIALGVGATAVIFAAVKSVLIDPLPYARPAQLVRLRSEYPGMQEQSTGDWVFWNDAQEVGKRSRTLESLGIYRNAVYDLAGGPGAVPEALYGLKITANLFPTLGVSPMLGRNILPEEDQPNHPDEMILSYGLWVRRFNSDPTVVGRTVTVNSHACLVIGVMPPQFNFPLRREAAHTPSPYVEFWAPLSVSPGARQGALGAVARLRPGVSVAEAWREIASIGDALTREFPASNRGRVLRLRSLADSAIGGARDALWMLMAATSLFMLIGCANVANLLLAQGAARQREMAVRLAIGAAPRRIVRQLLTESCVLAFLGGIGGYLLTAAAWKALPAIAPVSIPRLATARADSNILAFALALAILNGILFGMAPAFRLARGFHGFGLRGATSSRDRIRSSLIVAEVAISVLLVVLGGQLLGSFIRLIGTDPGFSADRVLASVVLPAPERYKDPSRRSLFYRRILDSIRALPGVESAGTTDALPFSGENHGGLVSAESAGLQPVTTEVDIAGGDYLQTMGVHLMEGRWFSQDETREREIAPANDSAIVDATIARRWWPGASPIGRRICVDCSPENPDNWKRVVGVVSSASHAALDGPSIGNVYLAAGAMLHSYFVVVRTRRPAAEMERAIRHAVAALDPDQPVFLTASMRDLIDDSVAGRRFIMLLLAITGCLALLMAAGGVYGVIAYATSRRTQEIGIRMAIGATPASVFALIFRQGAIAVALGLALGVMAAFASVRYLRGVLAGLETGNSVSIYVATGLVIVTAAIACWIPARRATRVDPVSALRQE